LRDYYIETTGGGYLHINCSKHDVQCSIAYKGLDPVMPLLQLECPKCGTAETFKLNRHLTSGFGFPAE
jgi:hypothetical protein